jgi:hypothetical protein
MALIVGFPNLAAAAKPTVADLNTAVTKIVEQIGGVDGDGVLHAGNLDTANLPAPGFRNYHKSEPYAVFPISVETLLPDISDAAKRPLGRTIGPFPMGARIVAATLAAEGAAGLALDAAGLLIYIDDVLVSDLAASAVLEWILSIEVPAGASVRVESQDPTYSAGTATELRATLWFKALHREA